MVEKNNRPNMNNSGSNNSRQKRVARPKKTKEDILAEWIPKTELGRKVKNKEITNIDEILDSGLSILEPEIVDVLLDLESDLILIGQSKGKFGGGQRRVFRQTQKKSMEGNKPKFGAFAVVGNKNGYIGLGLGKSKETIPAREKALRTAKLNLFRIRRGAGSWEDASPEPHSIPFAVEGKCGSVWIKLMPAPKGKGLICEKEVAKILTLAGVNNVWSRTLGQTKNKVNLVKAAVTALKQLSSMKVKANQFDDFSILDGSSDSVSSSVDKDLNPDNNESEAFKELKKSIERSQVDDVVELDVGNVSIPVDKKEDTPLVDDKESVKSKKVKSDE